MLIMTNPLPVRGKPKYRMERHGPEMVKVEQEVMVFSAKELLIEKLRQQRTHK